MIKGVTTIAIAIGVGAIISQGMSLAQTREKGPWWPSPHGPKDQAGASNYITPQKVVKAVQLVKTGQMYELGHVYEGSMPQYGIRPYFLSIPFRDPARPQREGDGIGHQDYFTGYIGQMGTQYDALGHQGLAMKMADGSLQWVFYNGFTEDDLTGRNRGLGGLEALGVENVKPIITRGILIDVAGYKGVPVLDSRYQVSLADVRGALAKQNIREASIEPGDVILFNYGWAVNWTNPSKYNDGRVGVGDNTGSPGIGNEVARWLTQRKVAMVGADSCCVGGGVSPGTPSAQVEGLGRPTVPAPRAVFQRGYRHAREHEPAGAGARPGVRVPVRRCAAPHQGRDGVAGSAHCDTLTPTGRRGERRIGRGAAGCDGESGQSRADLKGPQRGDRPRSSR